jgi:hypothetical protein
MSDKFLLLHPMDFERAKADGQPVRGQEITNDMHTPIVRDNFGVCKPGQGFEIDLPDVPLFPPVPPHLLFGSRGSSASAISEYYRYSSLRLPDPRKFISLEGVCEHVSCTLGFRLSLKQRMRGQRRRDYRSNVRRRKRWAELFARKRQSKT